jgi:hypothetical protein
MVLQRRLRLAIHVIGITLITLACTWSWRDLAAPEQETDTPDSSGPNSVHDHANDQTHQQIRPGDFDIELWRIPPVPVVISTPPPPPMPTLDLLGITTLGEQPAAMIFDPHSDEMLTLRVGESHGPTMILKIDSNSVSCIAHDRAFTLVLGGDAP